MRTLARPWLALLVTTACSGASGGDAGSVDGATGVDAAAATDSGAEDAAAPDAGGTTAWCPVTGDVTCGGDVLGTWAMRALCPEDPAAAAALCEHPYDDRPVCMGPGNEAICDGRPTGTLTFHDDGTVDVATGTVLVATWHFTDECLAAVATGATPEERCASIGNDRLTCAYDAICTCVGDPIEQMDSATATYAVTGNEITLGDDPPATYCVEGDRLTMDYYLFHPVSWRWWVLERP